jgi:hypothetical protein
MGLLLDPLEGVTDGMGGATATAPAPAEIGDVSGDGGGATRPTFEVADDDTTPTPASAPPRAAADPNQAVGTPQGWQSIRDAAAARGYQFDPNVQSDADALSHLVQQAGFARQQNIHAQLGRQLAPHAADIQKYLAQKQAPAPAERPAWEPPPFDKRWVSLVDRDASGVFVGKPGVPPEIVDAVNKYAEWREEYETNPASVLKPWVESEAKRIASETVKAQIDRQRTDSAVQGVMQANASWLYQADAAGNVAYSYDGRPMLSPYGQRYAQHVQTLTRAGVRDPRQQDEIAKQMLRADIASATQQATESPAAQTQATFASSRPNVNQLQSLSAQQRAVTPGATEPSTTGMSLRESLMDAFRKSGITDKDFAFLGGE